MQADKLLLIGPVGSVTNLASTTEVSAGQARILVHEQALLFDPVTQKYYALRFTAPATFDQSFDRDAELAQLDLMVREVLRKLYHQTHSIEAAKRHVAEVLSANNCSAAPLDSYEAKDFVFGTGSIVATLPDQKRVFEFARIFFSERYRDGTGLDALRAIRNLHLYYTDLHDNWFSQNELPKPTAVMLDLINAAANKWRYVDFSPSCAPVLVTAQNICTGGLTPRLLSDHQSTSSDIDPRIANFPLILGVLGVVVPAGFEVYKLYKEDQKTDIQISTLQSDKTEHVTLLESAIQGEHKFSDQIEQSSAAVKDGTSSQDAGNTQAAEAFKGQQNSLREQAIQQEAIKEIDKKIEDLKATKHFDLQVDDPEEQARRFEREIWPGFVNWIAERTQTCTKVRPGDHSLPDQPTGSASKCKLPGVWKGLSDIQYPEAAPPQDIDGNRQKLEIKFHQASPALSCNSMDESACAKIIDKKLKDFGFSKGIEEYTAVEQYLRDQTPDKITNDDSDRFIRELLTPSQVLKMDQFENTKQCSATVADLFTDQNSTPSPSSRDLPTDEAIEQSEDAVNKPLDPTEGNDDVGEQGVGAVNQGHDETEGDKIDKDMIAQAARKLPKRPDEADAAEQRTAQLPGRTRKHKGGAEEMADKRPANAFEERQRVDYEAYLTTLRSEETALKYRMAANEVLKVVNAPPPIELLTKVNPLARIKCRSGRSPNFELPDKPN